jgi:hypothetical protein
MPGYVVKVHHHALGPGAPRIETVCAHCDDEATAATLVKTALHLDDEEIEIERTLSDAEMRNLGLKPFQVKRMP